MSAIKVTAKLLSASCCVRPANQQLLPNQDISKETAVMLQFPGLPFVFLPTEGLLGPWSLGRGQPPGTTAPSLLCSGHSGESLPPGGTVRRLPHGRKGEAQVYLLGFIFSFPQLLAGALQCSSPHQATLSSLVSALMGP